MAEYIGESNKFWPEVGTRIGPAPEYGGNSGFEAYGKPVPPHRRAEADRHLKQMVGDRRTTEERSLCIGRMVEAIQRDEPETAFHAGMMCVDLTGTYRLLAVLLCHEEPVEIPAPASYLDLVDD